MKRKLILAFLSIFFFASNVFAQNDFKSEDELKEKAAELFEEEKFIEAEPLYAQLLSLYPKDATYNYKYGACLIAADEDKSKPLSFLEFAVSKSGVDPVAYYYLGKANHLNYNFGKAVKYYSRFKTKASNDQKEKFQLDRQIEMCKNGNQLLSKLNEVQVINREVVSEENFFRLYELEGIDGKLIAKPEEFKSKYDLKVNEKSVIYLPTDAKEVYYSSYGKKAESGRDIYKSIKLGSGGWSEGVSIGETINTPFDENYPFIHPDGKTLYFSSKGHNSMGGYDLFKSEFDVTSGQWGTPENLDFAFCSTDDDLLFVTDEYKITAYFASNRTNAKGEFTVYKVLVDRKPIELSVIQGKFIAENNPELQKATITVIDKATNKTIGVYETNNKGEYKLEIEKNGGTYQFNIETTDDAPIHTGVVEVPKQDEFEVLGQELRLVGEGNEQQLVIKNIFDGTTAQNINTSGPQVSANVLRAKANLDVNFSTDELAALEGSREKITSQESDEDASSGNTVAEKTPFNLKELSPEAIVLKNSYAEKQGSQKELITEKEEKVNAAYAEAIRLENEAADAFAALSISKKSTGSSEDVEKQEQEAKETALKAAFAEETAEQLEEDLNFDKKILKDLNQEEAAFNTLLQNNELTEAELKLETVSGAQARSIDAEAKIADLVKSTNEELRVAESALSSSKVKLNSLENEKEEIAKNINSIKNSASKAKGDKKETLEVQLEGLEMDLKDIEYQAQKTQEEITAQENEKKALAIKSKQLTEIDDILGSNSTANKVADSDKEALVNQIKTYRNNNQLAYINVAESSPTSLPSSNSDVVIINQLEEKFNTQLIESEGIQDIDLRNARKIQVYDNWINELEAEMIKDEAEIARVETEIEREELKSDIAAMQLVIDQKTILRDQAEEKATIGKPVFNELDSDLAEATATDEDEEEDVIPDNYNDEYEDLNTEVPQDVSEVDDLSLIPDDFTNFKFDQSIKFGNQRPSQVMGLAKKAMFEAREQSLKAEEARQQAYTLPTSEERAAAFERANEFEKESEKKQLEAADQFAIYNKREYQINQRRLLNANQFEDEFESDALDLANLLAEEGQVYFNDAAQIRREIDPEDRLSQKEVSLQKAYDYEILALKKQRQALEKLSLVGDQILKQEKLQSDQNSPAFVQTITDAEVLNVKNPTLAQKRADSLYATVESLEAEAKQKLEASENLPVGEERNTALVEYETAIAQVEQNKTKAAIYYERKKQLEDGSTGGRIRFAEPADGLTAPAYKSFKNEIALDTIVIEESRKNQILTSAAFVEYQKNKQTRDRIANEASSEYALALSLSEEKQQLQKQAIVYKNQAELETDKTEKQRLIKAAQVIDQKAARKQVEIDSLNTSIKVKNYLISTSNQDMKGAISNLSELEKKEIVQLAQERQYLASNQTAPNTSAASSESIEITSVETSQASDEELLIDVEIVDANSGETTKQPVVELDETPAITSTPTETATSPQITSTKEAESTERNTSPSTTSLASIDNVPRQLKEAIFITLKPNEAAYNSAKPIPVSSNLPEGLVYKVQVGAFRNPIPQDLFKGFAPLYAEKIPSGITRYTAGLFTGEASATQARNQIRGLGYPDAFVVAFLNGKRISIAQARGGDAGSLPQAQEGENFNNTGNLPSSSTNSPSSNQVLSNKFKSSDVAPVLNTKSIEKVYYTVQIGVFSKPLKKGVFDFEDLNVVELPNGLIRYNAGIYDSAIKAAEVKNSIQVSIPDAFVTAYKNGTRLSLDEASKLKNEGR